MRWVDLVKFLDSGVAMLGASADGSRLPEAFRVWGAIVKDDHRIRVLVTSDASRTFDSVTKDCRLALLFTDIATFRSVQVKGGATGPPEPATPADMASYRRYDERFNRALAAIGHPAALCERLRPWSVFAVDVAVDAMFDQTPGPGAGAELVL